MVLSGAELGCISIRRCSEDSRCLGVYGSCPLTVVDDEAPRYHRRAIHFNRHWNRLMICTNKGMSTCVEDWRCYRCPSQMSPPPCNTVLLGAFWKDERGNCICSVTARMRELYLCCAVGDMAGMHPKQTPALVLTRVGKDWLVVLSREQGTGLDLSWAGVQVHGGRCRNTRPVLTLHPGAQQIRNAAVYQNANIL